MPLNDRRTAAGLGLLGAAVTIVWMVTGADLLTDDFPVAHLFVRLGVRDALHELAFVAPVRPAAGPYYLLIYQGIGDRPELQALFLGLVNAGVVVVFWMVARRFLSSRTAFLSAVLFAVVPNRSATRLWFVIGANVLALTLTLVAAHLLFVRQRRWPAVALFTVALLMYEGVVGLTLLALLSWIWQERHARWRAGALMLCPIVACAAWLYVNSPKRGLTDPGTQHLGSVIPGLIGEAVWGSRALGLAGALVIMSALVWSFAALAPSFSSGAGVAGRELRIGGLVLVAGAAPFVVGDSLFAAGGVFDRNNMVAGVGTCVVGASLLTALARRTRLTGAVVSAGVVVLLAASNLSDLYDYRGAAADGRALVANIVDDVRPDPATTTVLVGPRRDDGRAVEQFILNNDLWSALRLRHGAQWLTTHMPVSRADCERLATKAEDAGRTVLAYDQVSRTLTRYGEASSCGTTARLAGSDP